MTKLIFCFDGTSNDITDFKDFFDGGSISNILKMHAFFGGSIKENGKENSQTPGQRSFYYSGIGTYGCWSRRILNKYIAPEFSDMKKIIENAAGDLNKIFQEGDEVYIFGFSRGASIARIFAAEINKHCKKVEKVKFLGVFDTVWRVRVFFVEPPFKNRTLGKRVEKAVHLVALDERRKWFQPTLFNKDERVEEIWFSGAHSDVGGGYWHDGLSDMALQFMMVRCQNDLQQLSMEEIDYDQFPLTDSDGKNLKGKQLCRDDVEIRPMYDGTLHAQQYNNSVAKMFLAPRKVEVMKDNKKSEEDVPIVHWSASEREHDVTNYRPISLRDVKYKIIGISDKIFHGVTDLWR